MEYRRPFAAARHWPDKDRIRITSILMNRILDTPFMLTSLPFKMIRIPFVGWKI
jgi:hypothetical protein